MAKILKHPRLLLLLVLLVPCWVVALNFFVDLKVIYYVVNLPLERIVETYTGAAEGGGRFFYGPPSLVLLRPLAGLSPRTLQIVWVVLQTLSYGILWLGLRRLYPSLWRIGSFPAWLLVFVLAINPIHNNFQSNNIQLMLMAALVWAEIFSRSSGVAKPFVAGLLTTLAAAVKIFPAFIVLFYFVARRRATKAGQIVGIALFGAVPFIAFGFGPALGLYRGTLANLTTYHADNSLDKVPDILCLPSLLTRFFGDLLSPVAMKGLIWGSLLAGTAAFLVFARRSPKERLTWGLALTLMTLLNPSTRVHYFIFLVPAFCSLVEVAALPERVLLVASAVLLALTTEFVVGKPWNDLLEFWNAPTWGMIALTVGLFLALLRNRFVSEEEFG